MHESCCRAIRLDPAEHKKTVAIAGADFFTNVMPAITNIVVVTIVMKLRVF